MPLWHWNIKTRVPVYIYIGAWVPTLDLLLHYLGLKVYFPYHFVSCFAPFLAFRIRVTPKKFGRFANIFA